MAQDSTIDRRYRAALAAASEVADDGLDPVRDAAPADIPRLRMPDEQLVGEHLYRWPWRNWFRRQCTCGLALCVAAAEAELVRNPDGVTPW